MLSFHLGGLKILRWFLLPRAEPQAGSDVANIKVIIICSFIVSIKLISDTILIRTSIKYKTQIEFPKFVETWRSQRTTHMLIQIHAE